MFKNKQAQFKEALDSIVQQLCPELVASEDGVQRAGERIEQLLQAESVLKAAMKQLNADSAQQLQDFIGQAIEERNSGLFLSFDEYDKYEEISQWLKQELDDSNLDLTRVKEAFRPGEQVSSKRQQHDTELQEVVDRQTLEINQLRQKLAQFKMAQQNQLKDRTDELKSAFYEQRTEDLQQKNAELTKDCTKLLNQLYAQQQYKSEYSNLQLAFQAATGEEYEYEKAMQWLACAGQQTQSEGTAERILLKISAILQILPAQKDFEEQILSWVELSAQMQQSGLFVGEEQLQRMQQRAAQESVSEQATEQSELAELQQKSQLLTEQLNMQAEQTAIAQEKAVSMADEQAKLQNRVEEQQAALFQKEQMIAALIAAQNGPGTQLGSDPALNTPDDARTQQSTIQLEVELADLQKADTAQRQELALAARREQRMLQCLRALEEDRNLKAWALEEQESALDAVKKAVAELSARAAEIKSRQDGAEQARARLLEAVGAKSADEAFSKVLELQRQCAASAEQARESAEQDAARLCKALQIKQQKTIDAVIAAYGQKAQNERATRQSEAQMKREAAVAKQREKEAQQKAQGLETLFLQAQAAAADLKQRLQGAEGDMQRLQDVIAAQSAQLEQAHSAGLRKDAQFNALLLAKEDAIGLQTRASAQLTSKLHLCELDMAESGDRLLALQAQALEMQSSRDQLAALMGKREEERNQLLYKLSTLVRAEIKYRSDVEALQNRCARLQQTARAAQDCEQALRDTQKLLALSKQSIAAVKTDIAAFAARQDAQQIASAVNRLLAVSSKRTSELNAALKASNERAQQLQGQLADAAKKAPEQAQAQKQANQTRQQKRQHDDAAALKAENARLVRQIQQKTQLNDSLRAEIGAIEQTFEDTVCQYQRVTQENAALSGALHALQASAREAAAGVFSGLAACEDRAIQRIICLADRVSAVHCVVVRASERSERKEHSQHSAATASAAPPGREITNLQRQNAELREDQHRLTATAVLLQQQISQFEMVICGQNAVIDDLRDLSAQQNAQLACLAQENDGARQQNCADEPAADARLCAQGEAFGSPDFPLRIAAQLADFDSKAAVEAKRMLKELKEDVLRFSEAAGGLVLALADWVGGRFGRALNQQCTAVKKADASACPEQRVFDALAAWLQGSRRREEASAIKTLQGARISIARGFINTKQREMLAVAQRENALEAQIDALAAQCDSLDEENFALLQHALAQEKRAVQSRAELERAQALLGHVFSLIDSESNTEKADSHAAAVLDIYNCASALCLEQNTLSAAVLRLESSVPELVAQCERARQSATAKLGAGGAGNAPDCAQAPKESKESKDPSLEAENAWLKAQLAALEELAEDNARELAVLKMRLARLQ